MSISLVREVLQSTLSPPLRMVAVVMATYAAKDGGRIFPSVPTVAREAGVSARAARRAISALRAMGVLVPEGAIRGGRRSDGRGISGHYWMDAAALPRHDNPATSVPVYPDTGVPVETPATRTIQTPTRTLATPTRTVVAANPDTSVRQSVSDPSGDPSGDPSAAPQAAPALSPSGNGNGNPKPPAPSWATVRDAEAAAQAATTTTVDVPKGTGEFVSVGEGLTPVLDGLRQCNPRLAEAWEADRRRRRNVRGKRHEATG